MLFNDTSAQFRPFSVLHTSPLGNIQQTNVTLFGTELEGGGDLVQCFHLSNIETTHMAKWLGAWDFLTRGHALWEVQIPAMALE